jgi:hypothetical protein
MSALLTCSIISSCLVGSVWVGMRLRRLLPEHHLSSESRDAVKLAMGLVATMTALLLGLLVSSAKGSYDSDRTQVIQMAGKLAFLDRLLALYGPETSEQRALLRTSAEDAVRSIWGEEGISSTTPPSGPRNGDAFYFSIQGLSPKDDTQRSLKQQILNLATDLGQMKSLLLAQSVASISKPLLTAVVCWLVIIFVSFSLLAPPNTTAMLALVVSALAVAGAIFLILELDHPFSGLIQISSRPIHSALTQPGK